MDLGELSQAMDDFVRAKGWYDAGSLRQQTSRNIAISLSLEAAEILEHFQWTEQSRDRDELSAELADVTLYLLQLARINGIDLGKAVMDKLAVNYTREWDKPAVKDEAK
jgi:NTP pyrophosphatase (non-canonical NTP hydrolase)